jgi:hypothetical protein
VGSVCERRAPVAGHDWAGSGSRVLLQGATPGPAHIDGCAIPPLGRRGETIGTGSAGPSSLRLARSWTTGWPFPLPSPHATQPQEGIASLVESLLRNRGNSRHIDSLDPFARRSASAAAARSRLGFAPALDARLPLTLPGMQPRHATSQCPQVAGRWIQVLDRRGQVRS